MSLFCVVLEHWQLPIFAGTGHWWCCEWMPIFLWFSLPCPPTFSSSFFSFALFFTPFLSATEMRPLLPLNTARVRAHTRTISVLLQKFDSNNKTFIFRQDDLQKLEKLGFKKTADLLSIDLDDFEEVPYIYTCTWANCNKSKCLRSSCSQHHVFGEALVVTNESQDFKLVPLEIWNLDFQHEHSWIHIHIVHLYNFSMNWVFFLPVICFYLSNSYTFWHIHKSAYPEICCNMPYKSFSKVGSERTKLDVL